jgi:acetyl-CoA carboxylase carboxyltransferase component
VPIHLDVGPRLVTSLAADRPAAASAALAELGGRTVAWFRVGALLGAPDEAGGSEGGAAEAEVVERAFAMAAELGCPVVGVVHTVAVAPHDGGVSGLAAWGRVAKRAVDLSGVVPILLAVTGPCHGGLAPLLGLADHVVLTRLASAYINGPRSVAAITGLRLSPHDLGGAAVHESAGLAAWVAEDEEEAMAALAELLSYLPDNHLADPPLEPTADPADRRCVAGPAVVPARSTATYDVREVVADVCDRGSLLEVRAAFAPNIVTAYARIDGRPVAVVANQPSVRAGTLDIDASVKAARHVQAADASNLPLVTFVDTPGYEPGRDLEWRGMIRHGAKLVHAYGEATVPRVCVILRKAYGGAYIVMDSRTLGSDLVLAWPAAEIAVMGAAGAVAILERRTIAAADDPDATRIRLEEEYRVAYCTPRIAAERGYVDQVIEPADTRAHVAAALGRLRHKRVPHPHRRHANGPL